MRKEASLNQWKELYDETLKLKALEPWKYLDSADLIAIKLQGMEEPVFMSVMGRLGTCYGVSMYEGMDGLADFDMVANAEGKNGPSIYDTMMDQSCITWYAGDRDEVPEAQKKVIKELGLKFRGKGQWQYFLSFEKGYTPFTLDARETGILTEAFKGLFMAVRAIKEKRISVDFEQGEILWRLYNTETKEWNMFAGPLPPCKREYPEIELEDQELRQKLKEQRQTNQELAIELAYLQTEIRDQEYDRPLCPRVLIVMDWKRDMILNMDLMRPEDYEIDVILNFFIPYVLSNGRMKKIRARNPWVFAALIEICEYCGIELVKTGLGKVDNILKEMMDRMG